MDKPKYNEPKHTSLGELAPIAGATCTAFGFNQQLIPSCNTNGYEATSYSVTSGVASAGVCQPAGNSAGYCDSFGTSAVRDCFAGSSFG